MPGRQRAAARRQNETASATQSIGAHAAGLVRGDEQLGQQAVRACP